MPYTELADRPPNSIVHPGVRASRLIFQLPVVQPLPHIKMKHFGDVQQREVHGTERVPVLGKHNVEQVVVVAFPHLSRVDRRRAEIVGFREHGEVRRGRERQQAPEHGAVEDMGCVGEVIERDRRLIRRRWEEFVNPFGRPFSERDPICEAHVRWNGTCFVTAILVS